MNHILRSTTIASDYRCSTQFKVGPRPLRLRVMPMVVWQPSKILYVLSTVLINIRDIYNHNDHDAECF